MGNLIESNKLEIHEINYLLKRIKSELEHEFHIITCMYELSYFNIYRTDSGIIGYFRFHCIKDFNQEKFPKNTLKIKMFGKYDIENMYINHIEIYNSDDNIKEDMHKPIQLTEDFNIIKETFNKYY